MESINHDIQKIIDEALKEPPITLYENIGGIVFPVTYFPNGTVIIDYPDKPFYETRD